MDFTPPSGSADAFHAQVGDLGDLFRGGDGVGGFSDFFGALFGSRRGGAGVGFSGRGADVESEVSITLEEAYRGKSRTVRLPVEEPCSACGGWGEKDKKACPVCCGRGSQTKLESFTVNIPRGVHDGSVIRVQGRGGAGLGAARVVISTCMFTFSLTSASIFGMAPTRSWSCLSLLGRLSLGARRRFRHWTDRLKYAFRRIARLVRFCV
jgi:DnaJ-class molecular chaperone